MGAANDDTGVALWSDETFTSVAEDLPAAWTEMKVRRWEATHPIKLVEYFVRNKCDAFVRARNVKQIRIFRRQANTASFAAEVRAASGVNIKADDARLIMQIRGAIIRQIDRAKHLKSIISRAPSAVA